jgi:D-glycero-alpha-D-manno-heptose 1-phosphate guanylyltransferase
MEGYEAIILAGSSDRNVPDCMTMVAGRPFISYIIDHLRMQGIERFIITGKQLETIGLYLQEFYPTLDYISDTETSSPETCSAIQNAIQTAGSSHVVVINGSALFKIHLEELALIHHNNNATSTLALKQQPDSRNHTVFETDKNGKIISVNENPSSYNGFFYGDVCLLNKAKFLAHSIPQDVCFEDFIKKEYHTAELYGSIQNGYFVDIRMPADLQKAEKDLQPKKPELSEIDKSWTLFLDRDGVINEEKLGEYVLHWGEFIFSKGVLDVFKKLTAVFGRIIIVSNQRGVGKGLMTEEALQSIHLEMQREVEIVGGHIDKIYYCTENDEKCFFRKPNPGMALRALKDFPGIDLQKSIMVGNKPSDMRFGRLTGMFTVFVRTTNPEQPFPHPDIDLVFPSLADFAASLQL